jgi:hypothetical protein
MWATTQNVVKHCGPQCGICLESDTNQIPCIHMHMAVYPRVLGCISTSMWLCIHVHVAVYQCARGRVSTWSCNACGRVSTSDFGYELWATTQNLAQHTVRPMSHMHLTNLQKRNRARWQMLFHPTELRSEFCNPLTFGQIHLSCAFCALLGWNMTQKIRLLLHHWSIPPPPSMQYFILIGWKNPVLPDPDIVFRPEHNNVRQISQIIRCNI